MTYNAIAAPRKPRGTHVKFPSRRREPPPSERSEPKETPGERIERLLARVGGAESDLDAAFVPEDFGTPVRPASTPLPEPDRARPR